MNDDDERQAITAAMQRLLAGTPLRSSGDLNIVALAREAGLKRWKLTHKHTDLKDQFYAKCKAQKHITEREGSLHAKNAELKDRVAGLKDEVKKLRVQNEMFARTIHLLTVENDALRRQHYTDARRGDVTPIRQQ